MPFWHEVVRESRSSEAVTVHENVKQKRREQIQMCREGEINPRFGAACLFNFQMRLRSKTGNVQLGISEESHAVQLFTH